ncbi:hypothetical protein Sango_2280300 [Sesamum angolense]|uniref:DUF4283 domain-containing protein n=1 Tax=Sesamum angolense TaxID=2727404 RepID=A0AAE2BL64_9LAMI|nr:hypothetical protein Sango_2280300 [Sesamum angolense]
MAKKEKAKKPTTSAGRAGKAAGRQSTATTSANVVTEPTALHPTSMAKENEANLPVAKAGHTPTGPAQPAIATAPAAAALPAKAVAGQGKSPSITEFQAFISDLEAAPFHAVKDAGHAGSTSNTPGHRSEAMIPGNESKSDDVAMKHTSFAGLFSNNRKLTTDNKLVKFEVDGETLKLETNDLIDVRAKLGHCLVGYIAGKFPGLKAILALSQSWGASFQLHDSGWLIFRFAKDEDRQRILAGGPYFVYGRPLLLKNMPGCFEFKEDDISLTPVWATLPSLPLECWHPNALGKIGSRLGTPNAMDSLTMKMERISYARILVEVDASKKLVDHVEFILPNGVVRKQSIIYEFTPKFCSTCHRFGHLKESCQPPAIPTVTATATAARNTNDAAVKTNAPKKGQPTEWTIVQRRHRNNLKQQQPIIEATGSIKQTVQQTEVIGSTKQTVQQTEEAGSSKQTEQQPIAVVPMTRRPAVVETDSETGSSGSSNVLDSPT